MVDMAVVEMSRLQFALTALYHFLFVPLTLGLSFMLVIMESVFVMTGKAVWRDATRFWGKLFGINFVLGVATGITMEFQFGTNWAYYSHYVGDIFGAASWKKTYFGLGISHRSGIFASSRLLGSVNGGSNYIYAYLESAF